MEKSEKDNIPELCQGCVYYPPFLPRALYSAEDWELLQSKKCSFDAEPGDGMCTSMRKGSCPLGESIGMKPRS